MKKTLSLMTAVLIGLTACQEKAQAPEASSLNATSETSLSEINGDGLSSTNF